MLVVWRWEILQPLPVAPGSKNPCHSLPLLKLGIPTGAEQNHLGDGGDKELMWTGCSLAVALGMLLVPWQLTISTRRHPCSQLLPGTGPHVALVPLEGN